MKITLLLTGKTNDLFIRDGYAIYEKRLSHYVFFETIIIPDLKSTRSLDAMQIKEKEAEFQLKHLENCDFIVLLDEQGKEFRTVEFAGFLQQRMNSSIKNLFFVIGGPYGFSEKIQAKANIKLSLSKMTFSHQIVRLLFMEQLYRAFTIIRNEPYHHEG
ncbi:MAG: 23S rRNA (pseudouridine(1915)-N(3))-methyltransferase RlmH [Bacteroidales bacterium]